LTVKISDHRPELSDSAAKILNMGGTSKETGSFETAGSFHHNSDELWIPKTSGVL
jgi:hypothetical protein